MVEEIPQELKKFVLDYYNKDLSEEYQISEEQFEEYFGNVLLNVRKSPVDTAIEGLVMLIGEFGIIILITIHIGLRIEKKKVKQYLKKNKYEEDLVSQLNNFVEEKKEKNKVILTKDFLVDLKYGGFAVFKYSDVKWIYIHNVKAYGKIVSSCLIVHLNDGKTKIQCFEIKGAPTEEFMRILNKIYEKVPADCLKGRTPENVKSFKIYKKELKNQKEA